MNMEQVQNGVQEQRARLAMALTTADRIYLAVLTLLAVLLLAGVVWQINQARVSPITWQATEIAVAGTYCPGDTLRYPQGFTANVNADLVSTITIRRDSASGVGGSINVAQVARNIAFSVIEGEQVEWEAEVPIPHETYRGIRYSEGPHYVFVSVTDPSVERVPARYRATFNMAAPQECEK